MSKLALPQRGFKFDDDAHRANLRALEGWATAPKESLQLIDNEELPPLNLHERHSIVRAEGEYFVKNGDAIRGDERWDKLVPDQEPYRINPTFTGQLIEEVKVAKWPAPIGGAIEEFEVEVDVAATANYEFDLLNNGASVLGTNKLVVPTGETRATAPIEPESKLLQKRDTLQIEVIDADEDAGGFVAGVMVIAGKNALGERIEVPGPAGQDGTDGTNGIDGADGEGVPIGGLAGQVLTKDTGVDFDTSWQNAGGGGGSDAAFQAINPATLGERWYPAPRIALGTLAIAVGRLYAIPFVPPKRGGSVDMIGYRVTVTSATAVGRAGIYSNLAEADPYPDQLLADGGELSNATSGAKTAAIAVDLDPTELYWLVCFMGVANVTLQAIPGGHGHPIYGLNSALSQGVVGHFVPLAYGALPATYPTAGGINLNPNAHPLVAVRFGA